MKVIVFVCLLNLFFAANGFGQKHNSDLIVFIGEKIKVELAPKQTEQVDTIVDKGRNVIRRRISMDGKYLAKYKILKLINGKYSKDTIDFIAFDHYGIPGFSAHNVVLLFVSREAGKLYHEKYQFFALYQAENGEWASPYSVIDYTHPYKKQITVKPERIIFKEKVSFPVADMTKDQIEEWYPSPYYLVKGRFAIAIYGNYVDDLFKLKQQTILKARGLY
ncbi:hypothetical protein [Hymenobacter persicinus]|uniref:Uncharacterized protein n=1 Tax=Hymenobacter persicinus TaxID=2025506 RepID=A0A4Q5L8W9_9BACT|nr:hypothetical protein [Hymenobacter persicinus]RYU77905.1 hypothetical protein EWM57_16365 [Hymenobacter persicinus]